MSEESKANHMFGTRLENGLKYMGQLTDSLLKAAGIASKDDNLGACRILNPFCESIAYTTDLCAILQGDAVAVDELSGFPQSHHYLQLFGLLQKETDRRVVLSDDDLEEKMKKLTQDATDAILRCDSDAIVAVRNDYLKIKEQELKARSDLLRSYESSDVMHSKFKRFQLRRDHDKSAWNYCVAVFSGGRYDIDGFSQISLEKYGAAGEVYRWLSSQQGVERRDITVVHMESIGPFRIRQTAVGQYKDILTTDEDFVLEYGVEELSPKKQVGFFRKDESEYSTSSKKYLFCNPGMAERLYPMTLGEKHKPEIIIVGENGKTKWK